MSKNVRISSLIVLAGALFSFAIVLPDITQAQSFFGGPLVPCEGGSCVACDLVALGKNILLFMVSMATLIATLLFVYAGILYTTSGPNPEQIEQAHKIFFNVVIGLVIVLASWLIVDTILRVLPSGAQRGGVAPWAEVVCSAGKSLENVSTNSLNLPNSNTGVFATRPTTGSLSTDEQIREEQARQVLAQNGIGVNKAPCPSGGSFRGYTYRDSEGNLIEGCTSLHGVQPSVIDAIVNLKNATNCPIFVTGGSEGGHVVGGVTGHDTGQALDIAPNACLERELGSEGTIAGLRCTRRSASSSASDTGDDYHCEATGS